jgi:hypothetical protein
MGEVERHLSRIEFWALRQRINGSMLTLKGGEDGD